MTDPTKNLPWTVERQPNQWDVSLGPYWVVVDSTGVAVCEFRDEALARMVAAGSVAGELYAACKVAAELLPPESFIGELGTTHTFCDARGRLRAALAKAAPLLEPKESP